MPPPPQRNEKRTAAAAAAGKEGALPLDGADQKHHVNGMMRQEDDRPPTATERPPPASSTPPPSDEELAAACELDALHERYARRLPPFLTGLGVPKSDLDDLLQDLWIKVMKRLRERPFQGHFRGWLFEVARNLAIDLHRRKRP